MNKQINIDDLIKNFISSSFSNEDDIKLEFYSSVITPMLNDISSTAKIEFHSEHKYIHGGRADALFRNISFEYKKYRAFERNNYIKEAIYGRNNRDRGLYQYIINGSNLEESNTKEEMVKKLEDNIGVGFDGNEFIFCRFIKSHTSTQIDFSKTNLEHLGQVSLPIKFDYKKLNLENGVERLFLLLKQQEKVSLSKENLQRYINPNILEVREDIKKIYDILSLELRDESNVNNRIMTLYSEWESVFGVIYGEESQETEFNEVIPAVKRMYHISPSEDIDIKLYLFAMQTYYNILLKLLINSFLSTVINPAFSTDFFNNNSEMVDFFEGRNENQSKFIDNFFEVHYYEWFTYSEKFDVDIVNSILKTINLFDLSTFVLKPEYIQDIFQEVYMGLIPAELRHIMGEYFSPDWIVELSLNRLQYEGDINKRIVDPACGSGAFLIQILKRITTKSHNINYGDIKKITNNVVGFDINPISAVSAKANYIIVLFSSIYDDINEILTEPLSIPVYIADSVLAPVVYSEQNTDTIIAKTHVGEFEIPKFNSYIEASNFLDLLSESIYKEEAFELFQSRLVNKGYVFSENHMEVIYSLYNTIYKLHRASKNSFWGKILKNSFAPIMINEKFDFVCGNPPWISWKSMSKTYRDGTGEVWRSYGIFEKNAYDKKTTHDDFGMAVTYVAIDQYLKNGGRMAFILPSSFLKSGKGGHGFRRFRIVRKNQDIPFSIETVDSFSHEMVFTINSNIVTFVKGKEMEYPMHNYNVWSYKKELPNIDKKLGPHEDWNNVEKRLNMIPLKAQPISGKDSQSQWLTLEELSDFTTKVLNTGDKRVYSGRKGIEPAGAKGVYILTDVKKIGVNTKNEHMLSVTTDFSRQRRKDILQKGPLSKNIEETYVYPMIGGRNIDRWKIKSNTFILVPHTYDYKYGIPEINLYNSAPETFDFLTYYKEELLASRIQNGKFFNKEIHPFYRLDNIGEYTYSPFKVVWKEQTNSMAAVVVSTYSESIPMYDKDLFSEDKMVLFDSKILSLSLNNEDEAHYVCGVINSPNIRDIIDGYAINTNRGTDVLDNIYIPVFDASNEIHQSISEISKTLHNYHKRAPEKFLKADIDDFEVELSNKVIELYK